MTTLKKIQQGITDLAIMILILALGIVATIVVSPWIIAAYLGNRKRVKHEIR